MFKRTLALLVIVLLVCLGLCACGKEVPPEQLEPLYGDWYVAHIIDAKTLEGVPILLTLNQDGTCAVGNQTNLNWTAKPGDTADQLKLTIKEEKKTLYTFSVHFAPEDAMYQPHISGKLTTKKDPYGNDYIKQDTEISPDIAELVCRPWYPNGAEGNDFPVEMKADGTCLIGGKPYLWTKDFTTNLGDDGIALTAFDESGECYWLYFWFTKTHVTELELTKLGAEHTSLGWYNFHPLLPTLSSYQYWYGFNQVDGLAPRFHLDPGYFDLIYIDGNNITFEYDYDLNSPVDQITLFVPSAEAPEYVLTMTVQGDYPNIALEEVATGEIYNYYTDSCGYDPENPEAIYYSALNALDCYINDNSYYDPITEEYYSDNELLTWAYARLQQVPEYRQSQEYLDRFTIHPNMLVSVNWKGYDRLGNEDERFDHIYYRYDIQGRLIRTNDKSYFAKYGILENGDFCPTYGDNNVITEIKLMSGSDLYAKCTPTYDESGKLISMDILKNTEEYTSTFTYNDNGQLAQMNVQSIEFTYTYDDAGLLIQEVETSPYASCATDYVYENGVLVQKLASSVHGFNEDWVNSSTYAYDENGNLLTKTFTSTESYYSYEKEEMHYIYEDVYLYTAP